MNIRKFAIERYGLGIADSVRAKRGEDIILSSGEVVKNDIITYRPYTPRSFAYCCDTAYSDVVIDMVKGVDLLYHEATFLDDDEKLARKTKHSTASQAGEIARLAGVKRLIVGHFSMRYKGDVELFLSQAKAEFNNCDAALPYCSFDVPMKKSLKL